MDLQIIQQYLPIHCRNCRKPIEICFSITKIHSSPNWLNWSNTFISFRRHLIQTSSHTHINQKQDDSVLTAIYDKKQWTFKINEKKPTIYIYISNLPFLWDLKILIHSYYRLCVLKDDSKIKFSKYHC